MNKIEEWKKLFLQHLYANNYSESARINYNSAVKIYLKYLSANNIKDDKIFEYKTAFGFKQYLSEYINARTGQKLTDSSMQNIMSNIKKFHCWLIKNSFIFVNPFDALESFKSSKIRLKRSIPLEDVYKILAQPDLKKNTGFRDRTMLEVFFSTGIRRAELQKLNIYDIDFTNGLLKVQGKGAKDRIVPIGSTALSFLRNYIDKIRPQFLKADSGEVLFLSSYGPGLNLATIGVYTKKYIKESGVKQKYSCHSFRHTCAVEMLKGNANIKHIQEMLGHSKITTTQVYTNILPVDLKKVHLRTHPSNWIFI
ncbi:tyrosine-type recombinase/integrase [Candidatus Dependentiae bacterium]|nr:tyrosine-type recombinase/integrase [Candidatus Dependentiae bacterium]